jgi:hypothetical protein
VSDINTPMGVIVCPQCSLPKLYGVYGYAGPQCQCWHPTPQPTLDIAGTLHQQSEEIRRLRAELAASRERFDKATAAFEREQDRALAAEVRAESAETALAASREREARMRAIAESAIKTRSRDVSDWADDMRRVAALAEGAQEPVHRPVHRPVHQPVHGELNNEA